MTLIMYATDKYGEGYCQQIGTFDSWEDIDIRVGMFADDIVINIEETNDTTDIE